VGNEAIGLGGQPISGKQRPRAMGGWGAVRAKVRPKERYTDLFARRRGRKQGEIQTSPFIESGANERSIVSFQCPKRGKRTDNQPFRLRNTVY